MEKSITIEYKEFLDKLNDKDIIERLNFVNLKFLKAYENYILNYSKNDINLNECLWKIVCNIKKFDFYYTDLVIENYLYDISIHRNAKNFEKLLTSHVISDKLLGYYQFKISTNSYNSEVFNKEIVKYYKSFIISYIEIYRPHLLKCIEDSFL